MTSTLVQQLVHGNIHVYSGTAGGLNVHTRGYLYELLKEGKILELVTEVNPHLCDVYIGKSRSVKTRHK